MKKIEVGQQWYDTSSGGPPHEVTIKAIIDDIEMIIINYNEFNNPRMISKEEFKEFFVDDLKTFEVASLEADIETTKHYIETEQKRLEKLYIMLDKIKE